MVGFLKAQNIQKNIKRRITKIKKQYNRNARLYLLAILFFYISLGAFSMLQGIYLKEIGIKEGFLGVILSFKTGAIALASIPCSMIADKIGKKKAIFLAMLFVPLCTIFQGLSTKTYLLLILAIVQGTANSFMVVCEGPFFMENSNDKNRVQLFSYSFATNVFSTMIGYTVFGAISESIVSKLGGIKALSYSMVGAGVLGLMACVVVCFIKENPNFKSVSHSNYFSNAKDLIKNRYASRFLIYNALIGFGAGLVVPYFNVYLKYKVNAGTDTIGVIMSLAQAAMGMGGLITPFMAKRLGRIKTINTCQILSIPFLLLIALPPNIYIVAAAMFMRNGLMNMAGPVTGTLTMELINSTQRSTFASINNIANNLSRAISTMVGGLIMAHVPYGYEVPYFLTALLYLAATILFHNTFAGYDFKVNKGGAAKSV